LREDLLKGCKELVGVYHEAIVIGRIKERSKKGKRTGQLSMANCPVRQTKKS